MAKNRRPTDKPAEDHLTELLQRIDRWLSRHRSAFYQALAPGAGADSFQALESALGKPLPDELRTWLAWHNGQGKEMVGAFVENWYLLSADQITEARKELDDKAPTGWKKNWLPFLDDDAGDYVCLCPGKARSPVREVWRGQTKHAIVAPSLTSWAEDFLNALEAGAFVEDEERGGFHRRGSAD